MPFGIIRGDLTRVRADAIVNTANPEPIYAAGLDRAIYEAAGADRLLRARKTIGTIAPGDAAVTPAFDLNAKYLIHTVGPVWTDGHSGEAEILSSCYRSCLNKALELGCASVAFPLIATGVYAFPKDLALQIALREISAFLTEHEMRVTLVVFDRASFALSGRIFEEIESLIDDAAVREKSRAEYTPVRTERTVRRARRAPHTREADGILYSVSPAAFAAPPIPAAPEEEPDLEELLGQEGETFQQCLFRMIDERGLKDSEVYSKANIDRKLFSKIRCNADYHPKKKTAVALAIALELSLEETTELLSKAEWALSSSSKFDIIVSYFIRSRNYDIVRVINPVLFQYHQPTLGA